MEHLSWVEKNDRQTIRLKWEIYEECKHTSVSGVAARHKLSWETVKRIGKEMIEARLKDRDLSGLRRLAIDEVSLAKRHKYLTVVTDLDERKVVWVGKGRKSKNLNTFLRKLPEGVRAEGVDRNSVYIEAYHWDAKTKRSAGPRVVSLSLGPTEGWKQIGVFVPGIPKAAESNWVGASLITGIRQTSHTSAWRWRSAAWSCAWSTLLGASPAHISILP